MKKAIVTGANGFVGSALCKALSEQGVKVIAIVRSEDADISKIKDIHNIRIVVCDISEFKNLANIISDRDVDVLYHMAWIGCAGPVRGNYEVQIRNVKYSCELVTACAEMDCNRLVFASSIMEYEIGLLMNTDAKPSVNTIYSSAKMSADYMMRAIAGSLGVEYIRGLISNIYGPGELSPRLINTSLRKLLFGEYCAFTPAEQLYDFIYITDAAEAFVAIGDKGIANRLYYIGSSNPKPLKEFLEEMRDCVDPGIKIGIGDIPFDGVSLRYDEFKLDAIKEDTGFSPKISFEEGIRNTIEWIREGN